MKELYFDKTQELVSVIIPAYNVEKYIKKCLDSVCNQSYRNIEILVVNDGSVDSTGQICKQYADKDNRIRYFEQDNLGQGAARNVAIRSSIGNYLVFVDADDWIDKDLIEELMKVLKDNDSIISACTKFYSFDEKTNISKEILAESSEDIYDFENYHYPSLCWKLFRKDLFITYDIAFPHVPCEDTAIYPVLALLADDISYVNRALYYYRVNTGNSTMDNIDHIVRYPLSAEHLIREAMRLGLYAENATLLLDIIVLHMKTFLKKIKSNDLYDTVAASYVNCLNANFPEWTKRYDNHNYLVIGSYNLSRIVDNSRFEYNLLAKDLKSFFGFSSIISLMSAKWEGNRDLRHNNKFRQFMINRDINKDFLEQNISKDDVILIDFLEERYDILRSGNTYLTDSEAVVESTFMYNDVQIIKSMSDTYRDLWKEKCLEFVEYLKRYDALDQVILVRTYMTDERISRTGTHAYENTFVQKINAVLKEYYFFFQKLVPNVKILDVPKEMNFTDGNSNYGTGSYYLNAGAHKKMAENLQTMLGIKKEEKKEKKTCNSLINDNEMPLVSIIIPVYNEAEYLEQCFDSALSQTYKNIEIIAVDDCSTDARVYDILDKYSRDPRFKCYKNSENCGISVTTNKAMMKAHGKWFAFLDCDDWLIPTAIEKMIDTLRKKKGASFGYSNRFNYDNKTGVAEVIDFSIRPTDEYYKNLQKGMYTSHLKVIHKSAFARVGLFEDKYKGTQDYDLSLKIAFYLGDDAFAYVKEALYYHRIHEGQTTQRTNERMNSQTELLRKIARKRYNISKGRYNKTITFIILSFNKMYQTLECIESIERTVKMPYSIVLLDNNSTKETKQFIKENIEPKSNIKVIYSPVNLGPAKGREEAIKHADSDYFVFLDNDIVVLENWLPELIVRMENYDNVAAVSCKVIFPDNSVNFNALKYSIEKPFITFSLSGYKQKADKLATCQYEYNDWVPAGATLYRADVYRKLQGLSEYPNTYEDNEAGFQLRKMGYQILNSPASIVIHNHFTYADKQKIEVEYLQSRYNEENLIKSSLVFFKRNGLIVRDEYILGKMGLGGKTDEEILQEFEHRASNMK